MGNVLESSALILLVFADGDRYPRAVLKTARFPAYAEGLAREWDTLCALRRDRTDLSMVPEPLGRLAVNADWGYLYRAFAGRTVYSLFRDRLGPRSRRRLLVGVADAAGRMLAQFHRPDCTLRPAAALAEHMHRLLQELSEIAEVPPAALQGWRDSVAWLAAARWEVPFGGIHGDFSPYNLIVRRGHGVTPLGLVDWEHWRADSPLWTDVCRFVNACGMIAAPQQPVSDRIHRVRHEHNAVLEALARPYLAELGVEGFWAALTADGGRLLQVMWDAFYLEAALTEQKRSAEPATLKPDCYLRAFDHLCRVRPA